MTLVLDIGGEGDIQGRLALSAKPDHPVWGQAIWFTYNIEQTKKPDIIGDAITLQQLKDASIDGIYSSHTIEHIDSDLSSEMFGNWFRVLKPGGRVEIRCPDVEWTWKKYFSQELPEAIITELIMGIRVGPYEVHRNLWWASKLISELESKGFINAQRINYGFVQPLLDYWPYDGKYTQYHGFKVIDLLIEAYKPDLESSSGKTSLQQVPNFLKQPSVKSLQDNKLLPGFIRRVIYQIRLSRQKKTAHRLLKTILRS